MKDITLIIMAAGMGSRYGGLKQIDPVGQCGEVILDYSLYDAIDAGFTKVVFVIKHEIEKDFMEVIGNKYDGKVKVEFAFQNIDDIPEGYTVADYGIIYIKSTMLKDSPLVLDDVRITKVATPVTVQSGDVEANAVIDMTAVDQYDDQYVFRAYVVYKNTADGSTVTTYNSGIVSGETLSDTASVALIDVTNAAGITVYAK